MTDLREAAQQALEALEEATSYTSCPTWSPSMTEECEAAAAALKAALAEPQEPVAKCIEDICSEHLGRVEALDHLPRGTLLYAAPPQRKENT